MSGNKKRAAAAALFFSAIALSGCLYTSTEEQINYGLNHYRMGLYDQAIAPLVTAAESMEKNSPPDPRLVDVLLALGEMAQAKDRKDLAAGFYPRALKAAEAVSPTDNKRLRNALVGLGFFDTYNDRPREALPLLQRASAISKELGDPILHAIDLDNEGAPLQVLGRYSDASQCSLRALEIIGPVTSGQYLERTKGVILYNLGASYVKLNRDKDAEALFRQSLSLFQSAPPGEVEAWRLRTVRTSYAELLRRAGRAKEADEMERAARSGAS